MTFEINEAGIQAMFADVAKNIEAVDQEIRREWAGKPAAGVAEAAGPAFARIGLALPDVGLKQYAEAVEHNLPFEFQLS